MRHTRTATGDRLAAKRRELKAKLPAHRKPTARATALSNQARMEQTKRQRWEREYYRDLAAAREAAG